MFLIMISVYNALELLAGVQPGVMEYLQKRWITSISAPHVQSHTEMLH